ncbi:MAG: hypothetical protein NTU88_10135 [Armatimonadetes bacterium]|nr:hypothetical protein [Armatimonadota bacterium]
MCFDDTHETLLIPLNDVTMDERNLEFAFARLDIDKLRIEAQEIGQRLEGRPIEFTAYRGPLDDEPVLGTAEYSYASWHSKETALYIELPQRRYRFDRQAGGEFGMTYLGRSSDGALYRFALAGDHKGDDYYKGGSGAPIVDSRGKVVSLLIGPDPSPNVLTGLPIRDYVRWLI